MKRVKLKEHWTEAAIAQALVRSVFNQAVLAVPCCSWAGSECDLLVVEKKGLRIVDVEIKISRADLRQDAAKLKWWHTRPWSRRKQSPLPRLWPDKVWKHYYVLPASIWDDSLYASIGPASGVIVISQGVSPSKPYLSVLRPAKPCRDAKPISAADAIDIARLASLRMWAALAKERP